MFLGEILESLFSARIASPCGASTCAPGACGGHISDPQIVRSRGWFGLVGGFDVILAGKGLPIGCSPGKHANVVGLATSVWSILVVAHPYGWFGR